MSSCSNSRCATSWRKFPTRTTPRPSASCSRACAPSRRGSSKPWARCTRPTPPRWSSRPAATTPAATSTSPAAGARRRARRGRPQALATKGGAKKPPAARESGRVKARAARLPADFPGTRYLFFGGKGGTGKTTAAAATALALLDAAGAGESLLLFSTDPAHSLSDSTGVEIGDRTAEVARRGAGDDAPRLFAREMDAAAALGAFKERHRAVLAEIADRGTILDEADINDLLDLSLPGMDEVMALFELSEVERAGVYARVVVDTAPSGHTSRMLRLPAVFSRWVGALDVMSEKHRYMVSHFVRGRVVRADEVDLFLRDLSERIEAVRSMLFDPARASFVLVTIPEAMAFEESARYFKSLGEEGVPVTDIVVNRVEREHDGCPFCRARVSMQARWLAETRREFESLRQHHIPLFPNEVRGPRALREFARVAWEKTKDEGGRMKGGKKAVTASPSSFILPPSSFPLAPKRLVIFGGKGGVGKTTAAAAYALALAAARPESRVLLFSTDPAHSLSDSFGEGVGEMRRGVAGVANLDA